MGKKFEIRLNAHIHVRRSTSPESNHETPKQKHARHMRERQKLWTEQQKQENRERSKLRMKQMRERKKLEKN